MVLRSSTATPYNTTLYLSRNNVLVGGGGFGIEPRNVENEEQSLKMPLKKEKKS